MGAAPQIMGGGAMPTCSTTSSRCNSYPCKPGRMPNTNTPTHTPWPYEVLPPDHPGKGTEGLRELRLGALEVLVAETPDAANVAVETLRARMWDGVLAMATVERNDESDPIALLQLSAAGLALVMRPAACGGLPAAFRTAVVEDSDIELAVAGWNGSDERNFEESFGLQTFWCQITELPKVAKACGYSKTGIKALVQAVLEPAAAMPKSKKMGSHDWSSPTLPPEIIKQAVLDVACIEHVFRSSRQLYVPTYGGRWNNWKRAGKHAELADALRKAKAMDLASDSDSDVEIVDSDSDVEIAYTPSPTTFQSRAPASHCTWRPLWREYRLQAQRRGAQACSHANSNHHMKQQHSSAGTGAASGTEARFQAVLARSNLLHCLCMHLFYVTAIQLAFVLRSVSESSEAPAAAGCEAQRAAGLLLPRYPCGGPEEAQARHVLAHALFYFVERPTRLADYGVAFNTAAMLLVTAWLLLLTTLMAAASLAQALRRGCSKTTGALRPVGRGRGGLLAAADPRGFSFGTNTSDSSGEFGAAEPSRRHACLQLPAAGASGQTASTAAAEGQQQLLLLPPAAQHSSSEPLVCRAAALCWRAWLRGRAAALTVTPLQSCVAPPSWRRLGSYQLVMGAVQRPVWDMALTALLMDGMRLRFRQMAAVREAAAASLPDSPTDVTAAAAGGLEAASSSATRLHLVAAWARAALRHLAVMLPLACAPLMYWWWSEQRMRRRLAQLDAGTDAAAASAATAGSGRVHASATDGCEAATGTASPCATAAPATSTGKQGGSSSSATRERGNAFLADAAAQPPQAAVRTGSSTASAVAASDAIPASPFGLHAAGDEADGEGATPVVAAKPQQPAASASKAEPAMPPAAAAEITTGHPSSNRPSPLSPVPLAAADATTLAQPVLQGTLHAVPVTAGPPRSRLAAAGRLRPLGSGRSMRVLGAGGLLQQRGAGAAAPYVGLTCMRTYSVKVRDPTGSHEEYAARLAAAVTPLILPPGIAAERHLHLPTAAADTTAAHSLAHSGPLTPQPLSCLLPTTAATSIVTSGSGGSSHLITQPSATGAYAAAPAPAPAAPLVTATNNGLSFTSPPRPPVQLLPTATAAAVGAAPVAPALTGGYVVVQGCVQLIAWVRGVDGAMVQRVVELNEEMAAALGLDSAAVAALMRQQEEQQHQMQQTLQPTLPPLLEAAGGGQEATPKAQHTASPLALLPAASSAGQSMAAALPAAAVAVQPEIGVAPPAPVGMDLPQALVQALPDASRIGQWTVQTPAAAQTALPPPLAAPVSPIALPSGGLSLSIPPPSAVKPPIPGAVDGPTAATLPTPHLPAASPHSTALPPSAAPAAGSCAQPAGASGAVTGVAAAAQGGVGELTIECAWTPCVPIAPASSPPLELELGLTSAAPQTLRLLLGNGMAATARFVMATVHQALQLHLMLDEAAAGQRGAAAPAADAAMQPWGEEEGSDEEAIKQPQQLEQRSPSPPIKLPPALPSPFSAAMQPWGEEESADEAEAAEEQPQQLDPQVLSPPFKLPPALPSPFSAAMQPWGEEQGSDGESASSAGQDVGGSSATGGAAEAPARQQSLAMKLPPQLPSPFAATMKAWSAKSNDGSSSSMQERRVDGASSFGDTAAVQAMARQASRQPSTTLKLPKGLPSPFAATSAPWSDAGSDDDQPSSIQRESQPRQQQQLQQQPVRQHSAALRRHSSARHSRHASRQPSAALLPIDEPGATAAASASSAASTLQRRESRQAQAEAHCRSATTTAGIAAETTTEEFPMSPHHSSGHMGGLGGNGSARSSHPSSSGAASSPSPASFALLEPAASNWSGRVTATQPSNSSRTSPPFSGRTTAEMPVALCELAMDAALSPQLTGPTTPMNQTPATQHSMTGAWQQHLASPSPAFAATNAAASAMASRRRGGWVTHRWTDCTGTAALAARRSTRRISEHGNEPSTAPNDMQTAASGAASPSAGRGYLSSDLCGGLAWEEVVTTEAVCKLGVGGENATAEQAEASVKASPPAPTPALPTPDAGARGSITVSPAGSNAAEAFVKGAYGVDVTSDGFARCFSLGGSTCNDSFGARSRSDGPADALAGRTGSRHGSGVAAARPWAAYGLYHARQALALDSWTLAYIGLKALVCLAVPLITTGTLDRQELLLVGPHLLLRMLSFAPKAAVLLLALCTRAYTALAARSASATAALFARSAATSAARLGTTPTDTALVIVAEPAWAVAWREAWVLACGYAELLLLMAPMALGLVPPPGSLVARLRGLGLELRLPHAAPLAAITWLAGLVTCLVLEVPRRIDFAAMHCGPAAAAVHQAARAALPPPAGQSGQQAPMQAR
eukprot:XP_001689950.1 predicted protein [Chlamydomonas reinhardtii]